MGCDRFTLGIIQRTAGLTVLIAAFFWVLMRAGWPVCLLLLFAGACVQLWELMRFATISGRQMASILETITADDATRTFSARERYAVPGELAAAMEKAMQALRQGRAQREEQTRYLQVLLAHIPVALIAAEPDGALQLLNPAARRLFDIRVEKLDDCASYGEAFVTGLANLKEGESALLPMDRRNGRLDLKADATAVVMQGTKRLIYSLQNIADELSAQELAAWQTVIRTMAHEVMNSLTPITSLTSTASEIVRSVRDETSGDIRHQLEDAVDALETVARRSEGLSAFVQNHRRLTHRLTTNPAPIALQRVFARLQQLLGADIATRGIGLAVQIEPETLQVTADADLLDQALINLLRNAMEAVRDRPDAAITLTARRDSIGHVEIGVADNGPGIAADQRDKIFVPFYTTRRQGTGIGLTLVRQIAGVHGATVSVSETQGGGATFLLRF